MAQICVALRDERVGELPAARPKKAVPQRHTRVAVIVADGAVLLERRPPTGIWGGLLALPEIPEDAADVTYWVAARHGLSAHATRPLPVLNHVFTHFRLEMTPVLVEVEGRGRVAADADHRWLALDELADAGLPTPVRRILTDLARGPQETPQGQLPF